MSEPKAEVEVEPLADVLLVAVPLLAASWAAFKIVAFGVTVVTGVTVMIYLSLSNDIDAATGITQPWPRNRLRRRDRKRPHQRGSKRRASLLLLRVAIALSELAACKQPAGRLAACRLAARIAQP